MDEHSDFSPLELQRVESIGAVAGIVVAWKIPSILLLHISLQSEFCYYLRAYWCRLFFRCYKPTDVNSLCFSFGINFAICRSYIRDARHFLAYKIMKYEVDVDY